MGLEIIKGNEDYFSECVSALKDSDLGVRYFSEDGSAKKAIKEGLDAQTMYVAVLNSEFRGFVYYIPDGAFHSYPYIHLLVVRKAARGMGVGTQLLKFLENNINRDKLFLVVADFNLDAKNFYIRKGFEQVGTIENLYRKGINEYLMMKNLKK